MQACNQAYQCGVAQYAGSASIGSTVRYQHTDMLGSVVAESDSSGTITSRSHYEPFGKRMGGDKAGIGYTGHLQDEDLGLTYMQARYYDPLIGRFYADDPVDATGHLDRGNPIHGFNRYVYANNNPYKYVDPDGESGVLISPKFTPRLSPVAQGVRQGIKSQQAKTNPVQQQTQKIANQMRDTVKNSKPEVRQPSLKEAPKGPKDTKWGSVIELVKQVIKHGEDLAGSHGATNTATPDASDSDSMSIDTKKVIFEAQILMTPPAPIDITPEKV